MKAQGLINHFHQKKGFGPKIQSDPELGTFQHKTQSCQDMLNLPGIRKSSSNFHWWADFGFVLNEVSLFLKDQNIPEMREYEMGIKFCLDMTRSFLQVAGKEYPSLPQDCVFTASSFSQLQRGVDSSIQEDIYKTLAGFSFLSDLHASCSSLITTWSSPLLALSFIPAPL